MCQSSSLPGEDPALDEQDVGGSGFATGIWGLIFSGLDTLGPERFTSSDQRGNGRPYKGEVFTTPLANPMFGNISQDSGYDGRCGVPRGCSRRPGGDRAARRSRRDLRARGDRDSLGTDPAGSAAFEGRARPARWLPSVPSTRPVRSPWRRVRSMLTAQEALGAVSQAETDGRISAIGRGQHPPLADRAPVRRLSRPPDRGHRGGTLAGARRRLLRGPRVRHRRPSRARCIRSAPTS